MRLSAAGEQPGAGRGDRQNQRQQEQATPGMRLVGIVGVDAQRGESGVGELHAATLVQAGPRVHPPVGGRASKTFNPARASVVRCRRASAAPSLPPLGPVVATEDRQVERASLRRRVVDPRPLTSQLGEQPLAVGFLRLGAGRIDDARGPCRRLLGALRRHDGRERQARHQKRKSALEVHAELSERRFDFCSAL